MHETIGTDQQDSPSYISSPITDSEVVVLVLPAIFAIDEDIEQLCDDIAYMGAKAVAIDPFWAVDPGPLSHEPADVRKALARKNAISKKQSLENMRLYCKEARQLGKKLLVLGICYGGHMAFCAAAEGLVEGAVIWHGGSLTDHIGLASQIKVPLSMHFGEADPVISMDDVQLLKEAFAGAEQVDISVYPGARHGFSHRNYVNFHPEAFEQSLAALERLIESHLEVDED